MPCDKVSELLLFRKKTLEILDSCGEICAFGPNLGRQDCIREDVEILLELKSLLTQEEWIAFLKEEYAKVRPASQSNVEETTSTSSV